jgi:UDP-galactopyranose mutase
MASPRYLIVGAGFSGAVLARELAERLGARVVALEAREHVAGNCHTERDAATGIMVHMHGPHIFNTDNLRVWTYVQKFGVFRPYINRVKACTARGIFVLPINLHTINQFFGKTFNPREARAFLATLGDPSIGEPQSFEEQALKTVGRELYETFLYGYTRKQWGSEPRELPASILKRLPVRFNYDDTYYARKYQGIPEEGYTVLIERILDHPGIELRLGTSYRRGEDDAGFEHTFFTGPLDAFFHCSEGRLGYRTVTFERIDAIGDYQGNPVINYPDLAVPWTRIHEHKHFAPWESHERTVAFREYSKETAPDDLPYYPKRLAADKQLLARYRRMASAQSGLTFLGRLATYRYMDMETVIGEALALADEIVARAAARQPLPVFPNEESSSPT